MSEKSSESKFWPTPESVPAVAAGAVGNNVVPGGVVDTIFAFGVVVAADAVVFDSVVGDVGERS